MYVDIYINSNKIKYITTFYCCWFSPPFSSPELAKMYRQMQQLAKMYRQMQQVLNFRQGHLHKYYLLVFILLELEQRQQAHLHSSIGTDLFLTFMLSLHNM
jgi:hypothetical protein